MNGVGRVKDKKFKKRDDLHRVIVLSDADCPKKILGLIHYKFASIHRPKKTQNPYLDSDKEECYFTSYVDPDTWKISNSLENAECKIISLKVSEEKRRQNYGTLLLC